MFIESCDTCGKFKPNNIKEPLISHSIPEFPFNKVYVDVMECAKTSYLVFIDYFSKWLAIKPLKNKDSGEIIKNMKKIFFVFGIPLTVVSDNMPFNSKEFRQFTKEWGFHFV